VRLENARSGNSGPGHINVAKFITMLFECYLFLYPFSVYLIFLFWLVRGIYVSRMLYMCCMCICSFITSRKEIIPLALLVLSMLTVIS